MKLRCVDGHRVLVLSKDKAIHRKDGSKCEKQLLIGSFRGYAPDVVLQSHMSHNS